MNSTIINYVFFRTEVLFVADNNYCSISCFMLISEVIMSMLYRSAQLMLDVAKEQPNGEATLIPHK